MAQNKFNIATLNRTARPHRHRHSALATTHSMIHRSQSHHDGPTEQFTERTDHNKNMFGHVHRRIHQQYWQPAAQRRQSGHALTQSTRTLPIWHHSTRGGRDSLRRAVTPTYDSIGNLRRAREACGQKWEACDPTQRRTALRTRHVTRTAARRAGRHQVKAHPMGMPLSESRAAEETRA